MKKSEQFEDLLPKPNTRFGLNFGKQNKKSKPLRRTLRIRTLKTTMPTSTH
jgi:hypothetical protein